MGAPIGNKNAAGKHRGLKISRHRGLKILKHRGLIKIPRTHKELIKGGFKKTKWKNIYIG